jgi:DNA-binding MarR family transcriptional regulator
MQQSSGAGARDAVVRAAEQWRAHGWPAGPRFLAALSVLRAEEIIRRSNAAALEPHGLTHTRHEALALLYFSRDGALPLGTLSERMMVHPTSTTSTIDALERLGLVERARHPSDRRTTLARITAAGRVAFEASSTAMAAASFAVGSLSDDEALQLFTLLGKVRAAAGDTVEAPEVTTSPAPARAAGGAGSPTVAPPRPASG